MSAAVEQRLSYSAGVVERSAARRAGFRRLGGGAGPLGGFHGVAPASSADGGDGPAAADAADVSGAMGAGSLADGQAWRTNGNWGFLPSSPAAAARARNPSATPSQDPWWVSRRQTLSQLTSATERRRCTPPSGNLALGTDAGTNAPTPAGAAAKAVAASKVAHDVAGSSFHTLQGGGHALQGARLHSLSMRGRMPGRNGP